jgi:hypothetical protein
MLTGLHVVRTVTADLRWVGLFETKLDLLVHHKPLTFETWGYV